MKYLQQSLQSFLFLIAGVGVLTFSLHFSHVEQIMAASNSPSPTPTPTSWLDSRMPGTVPYMAQRISDKVTLWKGASESEKAVISIEYSRHRLTASQYAFEFGNYDVSVNTLSKSLGYLAHAHMLCGSFDEDAEGIPECEHLQPLFDELLTDFVSVAQSQVKHAPNDTVRMQIQRILTRAESF